MHNFQRKVLIQFLVPSSCFEHHVFIIRSAITGLEWPRGFQEVKVTRFHDKGTGWR